MRHHLKLRRLIKTENKAKLEEKSGVSKVTINNWCNGDNDPRLSLFNAVLNVVGHKLVIVPLVAQPDPIHKTAEELVASVYDDIANHGSLTSTDTVKLADQLKLLIWQQKNGES